MTIWEIKKNRKMSNEFSNSWVAVRIIDVTARCTICGSEKAEGLHECVQMQLMEVIYTKRPDALPADITCEKCGGPLELILWDTTIL